LGEGGITLSTYFDVPILNHTLGAMAAGVVVQRSVSSPRIVLFAFFAPAVYWEGYVCCGVDADADMHTHIIKSLCITSSSQAHEKCHDAHIDSNMAVVVVRNWRGAAV
jgi:hypothetical protein